MDPIGILKILLIAIACVSFIYGIYKACKISWPLDDPDTSLMPAFLSNLVTSIAAILATNLGAVVGFTVTNESSIFRDSSTWSLTNLFTENASGSWQTLACYIYILGLLAAAIVWARKNFTADDSEIMSLIPQLTKSLVGVIIGVLAISLNVPQH